MHSSHDKTAKNQQESAATIQSRREDSAPAFQFKDNRSEAVAQRQLQEMMQNSPKGTSNFPFQAKADQAAEKAPSTPVQKKENKTGLPDNLKSGVENLSGIAMDDVKVHYNSAKPAQMQAHAYAQGTNIHVAPGQEKHLPHEAWHVVQQKQGRVKPTTQLQGGVNINDDKSLEREADLMGSKSLQRQAVQQQKKKAPTKSGPIQMKALINAVMQLAKKPSFVTIGALSLEGLGHVGIGIALILAGVGKISTGLLAVLGIPTVIAGVGQVIVGVSKWVRAGIMAWARRKGELSSGQKTALATLTSIEAGISIATAVTGAATAHAVVAIIAKVISAISAFVKFIRGLVSIEPKEGKKIPKYVVIIEAIIGALSAVADVIEAPANIITNAVMYIVNLVKEVRGVHGSVRDTQEKRQARASAEAGETQPLLSGQRSTSYGSTD